MTLPTDPQARKAIPIYSGFFAYFPRAIAAVAELSRIGNDQHNPGKPLHWDRSKSGDEKDALLRHLLDQALEGDAATDSDNVLHATKKAWRGMADLEKILEKQQKDVPDKSRVEATLNKMATLGMVPAVAEYWTGPSIVPEFLKKHRE